MKEIVFPAVSVVIPMYNGSSTIISTLKSVIKQDYPIKEIIIVNDASADNSDDLVKNFAKKNKKARIILINNKQNLMIARTISRGVYVAKSKYVVLTHADCEMVGRNEIKKLVQPFLTDESVVGTYGYVTQPISIWLHYSFWEKFLFAFRAGKVIPGMVGKIDCIKKDVYQSIGGHDIEGHDTYGGEDADIHMRLDKVGKTVVTPATVEHLHYIYDDFSFEKMLAKRKEVAQAYGVLLSRYGFQIGLMGMITTLLKPVLAVGLLIPYTSLFSFVLIVLLFIVYYKRMLLTVSVVTNPLILLTPVAFFLLLYYESFWSIKAFIQSLISRNNKR